MRSSHGRFLAIAAGLLALSAPAFAGSVTPEVLQGSFIFNDSQVGPDHCSTVDIDGATHQIVGIVTGIGTDDDTITLTYTTPFVDRVSANPTNGKVQEREQTQIDLDLMPGAASATPAYTGTANPEKGRAQARVTNAGLESRIVARFQLGSDLSGLTPPPDAAQLASILVAFDGRDDVRIRTNNGNVRLHQDGLTAFVCP